MSKRLRRRKTAPQKPIGQTAGAPIANRSSDSPAGGITMTQRVQHLNGWREQYNPLRGMSISRAVNLLEMYQRGEMADLQWTYFFVEGTDPDLMALVERRTSALVEMDWNIKVVSDQVTKFDKILADEQQHALRETYERIDNIYEAIEHQAMATFRGFAHCEKHRDATGEIVHLEPLDQWNVVRDGMRGQWRYNPDAQSVAFRALPEDHTLNPEDWIIREVRRQVNRIALIKFIRSNLGQKDWDAFIEIYGIPPVFIVGPPNVPQGKESEYQEAAEAAAKGGSGYLPHGATATIGDGPRGVNPFSSYLQYLSEKLILVGTGGKLTMLAESGSGTLAGGAHSDTFKTLGRAEARKISEDFQAQIDKAKLAELFPDRPGLAYFAVEANEEQDIGEVVDHVGRLSVAGYQVDPDEVTERTGYKVTLKPQTMPQPGFGGGFNNRRAAAKPASAAYVQRSRTELAAGVATDLQPVRKRLEAILDIEDPEIMRERLAALQADMAKLKKDINADPESAKKLEAIIGAALVNGIDDARQALDGLPQPQKEEKE